MVLGAVQEPYWAALAHSYAALGPPLKPSGNDLQFMEGAVAEWAARHPEEPVEAMLLGVTTAIALMRWPARTRLLALDSSEAMIRAVWPGDVPGHRRAVRGNWLALPRQPESCAVVIGDGSLNCVRYPGELRALAAAVSNVLRDDGIFVLRCYVQRAVPERPQDVLDDLLHTSQPSFHHFKFRLLLAMQRSAPEGTAVQNVYRFWTSQQVDVDALIARTGWDRAGIELMNISRNQDTVHTFPSLPEWRAVLSEFFDEESLFTPPDPLGACCPTLVLRPRRGAPRIAPS